MNKAGEAFENAILHWRDVQGVGTALIPAPLNDKVMVLGVLQRVYARSPTCKTLIITNNFQERQDIIEFLTHQEDEDNNKEFKSIIDNKYIKVFTVNYITRNFSNYVPFLTIVYHPETFNGGVLSCVNISRFKLVVLNKLLSNYEDMTTIYKICPLLDDFKANEIEEIRLSLPVEEMQIGVTVDTNSETYKFIKYCDEYISTSISIFGSFDVMQQARTGNNALNISANQICAQIAQENGWNENLDMSVEFNVQLDNLYNPMNLKERASQTYEKIRQRSQTLSDYDAKLDEILKIVEENFDKQILVINKRGEFASRVTDYLNNMSECTICGNYHDRVEKVPMLDDKGHKVYYKSGTKKGELRYMGADAQKTRNEQLFREGIIRVLSTNNAPNKDLCVDVDIIIITSSQCESIKSYMYRLSNITYKEGCIKLFTLYCKDTMEQRLMDNRELANNHRIVNNCENDAILENNSDFVIVD